MVDLHRQYLGIRDEVDRAIGDVIAETAFIKGPAVGLFEEELARLLERVGGGNASATELYQLQFLVGMLRVQATGGAKLSQQVNQGFESLLKQQG